MKFRFIIYFILAVAFQVILGQLTDQGQGGIAMLTFIVMVEIDPKYSFTYLLKKPENKNE